MHPPGGYNLIFGGLILACVISAVITVTSFFLYVRARMAYREAEERRYRSIHFITLFLFVLFGVLILIRLSDKLNSPSPDGRYSFRNSCVSRIVFPTT